MEDIMKKEKQKNSKVEKSYSLLIFGAVAFLLTVVLAIYTYNTGYKDSLAAGSEIAADAKLDLERPYAFSLTAVFVSAMLLLRGLYLAVIGVHKESAAENNKHTTRMIQAGLLAALCYIGFAFLKIDIPVGTEKTAFHLGNTFCALAALLLGGYWGGLAGAVGMTIGDLTTSYVTSAPKTFFLKLMIGLIVGFFAHKVFKLSRKHDAKYLTVATLLSCIAGLGFNVVADPLVGYFYKTYLFGLPQDISKALAKMSAITTFVNAVVAVAASTIIYHAIRPALRKAGLFVQVTPEKPGKENAEDGEPLKKTSKEKTPA